MQRQMCVFFLLQHIKIFVFFTYNKPLTLVRSHLRLNIVKDTRNTNQFVKTRVDFE